MIIGVVGTVVVLVLAAKRVLLLTNLIRSGQKTIDEDARKDDLATRITTQFKEVFAQTRLLRWSIPGIAHFFTMWGFFILASVYVEAYGVLFNPKFAIPFVGHWDALGLPAGLLRTRGAARHHHVRDHPAALRTQGVRPRLPLLRLAHRRRLADPVHDLQRHLDVRAVPRRGQRPTQNLPYGWGAFFSHGMGALLCPARRQRQPHHRDASRCCCTSASCWSSC